MANGILLQKENSYGNSFNLGDIKGTVSTEIQQDKSWRLCDGSIVRLEDCNNELINMLNTPSQYTFKHSQFTLHELEQAFIVNLNNTNYLVDARAIYEFNDFIEKRQQISPICYIQNYNDTNYIVSLSYINNQYIIFDNQNHIFILDTLQQNGATITNNIEDSKYTVYGNKIKYDISGTFYYLFGLAGQQIVTCYNSNLNKNFYCLRSSRKGFFYTEDLEDWTKATYVELDYDEIKTDYEHFTSIQQYVCDLFIFNYKNKLYLASWIKGTNTNNGQNRIIFYEYNFIDKKLIAVPELTITLNKIAFNHTIQFYTYYYNDNFYFSVKNMDKTDSYVNVYKLNQETWENLYSTSSDNLSNFAVQNNNLCFITNNTLYNLFNNQSVEIGSSDSQLKILFFIDQDYYIASLYNQYDSNNKAYLKVYLDKEKILPNLMEQDTVKYYIKIK